MDCFLRRFTIFLSSLEHNFERKVMQIRAKSHDEECCCLFNNSLRIISSTIRLHESFSHNFPTTNIYVRVQQQQRSLWRRHIRVTIFFHNFYCPHTTRSTQFSSLWFSLTYQLLWLTAIDAATRSTLSHTTLLFVIGQKKARKNVRQWKFYQRDCGFYKVEIFSQFFDVSAQDFNFMHNLEWVVSHFVC